MTRLLTPGLAEFEPFLVSLAIGLLLGMEREGRPSAKAGLRTFGLVALLGSIAALLSAQANSAWPMGAGFLALAGMMVAANRVQAPDGDPGTTTVVALLLCFGLGAMTWYGEVSLAVMLAIVAAVLLHLKTELHGIAARVTQQDLGSVLQFATIALILLPILPDRDMGPFHAFNAYRAGLMVVLVSGVGLAGYAATRLAGAEHGILLAGILGGLVSSTATTIVFSRRAAAQPALRDAAGVVILLANITMFLRVAALVAVVAPGTLIYLALPLGLGAIAAVAISLLRWRRLGRPAFPASPIRNPTELPTAFGFGAMYSLILVFSAGLWQWAGAAGVYSVAFVGGIPDVDAASLSCLRLLQLGKISTVSAAVAVALALLANMLFKTVLVVVIGRGAVARAVVGAMLLLMACVVLGLLPLALI